MKQLLVLDWRQRAASRSQLKLTVENTLDTGRPRAYDQTRKTKRFPLSLVQLTQTFAPLIEWS